MEPTKRFPSFRAGDCRGITLTQPWASAIACGLKTLETRSWSTSFRGTVLIHASRAFRKVDRESFETILQLLDEPDARRLVECLPETSCGLIVACAELHGCVPTVDAEQAYRDEVLGNFAPGRFAFQLRNVMIPNLLIEQRGALGLWKPKPDLLQLMDAMIWSPAP